MTNPIEKEMLRLKELGKIDGTIGAKKVGMVLDSFNANVDLMKEKKLHNDLNDRNLYYWKLWQRAIEDIKRGEKPREKSKPYISLPPNMTKPTIFTADGKKYVPNAEQKSV